MTLPPSPPPSPSPPQGGHVDRILVIRLGALGDFVQSFGPFAAIRDHHPDADITLLTTQPFAALARSTPWFDHVRVDDKPSLVNLVGLAKLAWALRKFDRVYDLQTSARSSRYFVLAGRPPWSGVAKGCAFRQSDPGRETMHTWERQRDQLRIAGIEDFPQPDLSFLTQAEIPALPRAPALLAPGSAPQHRAKRWPVARYAELATILAARGFTPVIVGAAGDAALAAVIRAACPEAIDLTGKTDLMQLFAVAAQARLAIGNDTGPMHVAASAGCRCIVLFGRASDPALTSPRGPDGAWAEVLRAPVLADLAVARVVELLP